MILTEGLGPLNPFYKKGDFGHGEVAWNEQPEFEAFEKGVAATLVALATTDEELVLGKEKISNIWHEGGCDKSNDGSWHYRLETLQKIADAATAKVIPILRARAVKHEQEAVEKAKREILGRLTNLDQRKGYCTADFDEAVQEYIQELRQFLSKPEVKQ